MSKITNKTPSSRRLIDIWLWGRSQFNKKWHIVDALCKSGNTIHHRTSYRTFFVSRSVRSTQDSTFLWCYIVVIKQNECFSLASLWLPTTIASLRIEGKRKDIILRIVDIDAAYLHNQKFIHLLRLFWARPVRPSRVRFSRMVKYAIQSGKEQKHHKMLK